MKGLVGGICPAKSNVLVSHAWNTEDENGIDIIKVTLHSKMLKNACRMCEEITFY